ncbi:hypothetical protein HMI55_001196 [Coelomomyces lativittatus]|nr:hypothetical protein HMI55_001196 [Coelomomyces lativittatus]
MNHNETLFDLDPSTIDKLKELLSTQTNPDSSIACHCSNPSCPYPSKLHEKQRELHLSACLHSYSP